MNIPSLDTPVTPPYDCHKTVDRSLFDQPSTLLRPIDRIQHRSAFHRVVHQPNAILSPPELVHDSEEEEEDMLSSPSLSLSPQSLMKQQGLLTTTRSAAPDDEHDHLQWQRRRSNNNKKTAGSGLERPCMRRKSVPLRSPSAIGDPFQSSVLNKSVVFQLHTEFPLCTSQVISGESLLSALRRRVAVARQQRRHGHRNRLSACRPSRKPTQIQIPKSRQPKMEGRSYFYETSCHPLTIDHRPWLEPTTTPSDTMAAATSTTHAATAADAAADADAPATTAVPITHNATSAAAEKAIEKKQTRHHSSSSAGRPSRVKGPCQACQETSDGCMRKAFNWPFPSSSIFNDKGKPFVYLCNKCGLRYNKSGGSVCRHCRWVFCKEEKRKAMQHIDQMRRSRPDGRIDPNEQIENFVCTPKYWTCGRPWKVGWVLNGDDLPEDDDMDDTYRSPSPH